MKIKNTNTNTPYTNKNKQTNKQTGNVHSKVKVQAGV